MFHITARPRRDITPIHIIAWPRSNCRPLIQLTSLDSILGVTFNNQCQKYQCVSNLHDTNTTMPYYVSLYTYFDTMHALVQTLKI